MAVTPIWDNAVAADPATRPGVYINFASVPPPPSSPSATGIVAVVATADWGPLDTPTDILNKRDVDRYLGTNPASEIRTELLEMIEVGAAKVIFYRIAAAAAAKATLTLNDSVPAAALTVTAKYEGTFGNSLRVAVVTNVVDPLKKDLLLYEGTVLRESFTGATNTEIVAAFTALGSEYVDIALSGAGARALANVTATPLAGGNSGTGVVSGDYVAGWEGTQGSVYSTIVIDTSDAAIQASFGAWVKARRVAGYRVRGFVGSAQVMTFADKLLQAQALNDEGMHYVVSDYVTRGGVALPPYRAAGTLAAVAALRAYRSITNYTIDGATQGAISLSSTEYAKALTFGMLVLSWSGTRVYIESGINTLQPNSQVAPKSPDWRKMRYVACQDWIAEEVWLALMDNYVGQIENDERGRAEAVRVANDVVSRAVQLGILDPDADNQAYLDDRYESNKDRVFLAVSGSFVDAIEKFFLTVVI